MKVANLLAQYFYVNKRLDLPGLGSFILDPTTFIEAEPSKQNHTARLDGVSFESNTSIKEAPELVQFIASKTGKIKALAAADLESHLGLALQFLNIGKPFLFEGIGTITKIKSGKFSFTSGKADAVSAKTASASDNLSTPTEESLSDYKSILYKRKQEMTWKKPVAVMLFLVGLTLTIWGGYTVYKRTIAKNKSLPIEEYKSTETLVKTDTALYQKDSLSQSNNAALAPKGSYKFVLEIATIKRAFSRLNKLLAFQWPAQMETKDSVTFKIFMLLPLNAADSTRFLDSLSRLNGKRVYIE